MHFLDHYVIDWDKVKTIDDLKNILARLRFGFGVDSPDIENIRHFLKRQNKSWPHPMPTPEPSQPPEIDDTAEKGIETASHWGVDDLVYCPPIGCSTRFFDTGKEIASIGPDGVMRFSVEANDENAREFIKIINNLLGYKGEPTAETTGEASILPQGPTKLTGLEPDIKPAKYDGWEDL